MQRQKNRRPDRRFVIQRTAWRPATSSCSWDGCR